MFKRSKCKNCSCLWTQHKGLISEELLRGFLGPASVTGPQQQHQPQQGKEDDEDDGKSKGDCASRTRRRQRSVSVEDEWLFDAPTEGGSTSESDRDADIASRGFQMLDGKDLPISTDLRSEGMQRVTNLIDFSECDLPEKPGGAPADALRPSQLSLLLEVQYLRQRLAAADEEKRLEIEVLQEQLDAEQAAFDRVRHEAHRVALVEAQECTQESERVDEEEDWREDRKTKKREKKCKQEKRQEGGEVVDNKEEWREGEVEERVAVNEERGRIETRVKKFDKEKRKGRKGTKVRQAELPDRWSRAFSARADGADMHLKVVGGLEVANSAVSSKHAVRHFAGEGLRVRVSQAVRAEAMRSAFADFFLSKLSAMLRIGEFWL